MSHSVIHSAGRLAPVIDFLMRPRRLLLGVLASFVISGLHAMTMLPLGLVMGTSTFWDFPAGTVPGSGSDMGQVLVAYHYFVQAPWAWPLLHVTDIVPPKGTNILWMDAVPFVSLIGKIVFTATGQFVNLLGYFLFVCFALPGVAMTMLVWIAGQRSLVAALASAAITSAAPFLIVEWGHMTLCGQVVIIFALCCYLLSLHRPQDSRVAAGWVLLLAVTILMNMYLFVMVGGIWAASVGQRLLDRQMSTVWLLTETGTAVGLVLVISVLTGILSSDLRSAGTSHFGAFSMNLASPFIPQRSGVIPPLREYFLGSRSQVFNYVGLGALVLMLCSLPTALRWLRGEARAHVVMLLVLMAFWLFAVSHQVTLGGRLLFTLPLPEAVLHIFGAFRASGRFFWPLAYSIIAVSIVLTLKTWRPATAVGMLTIASVLQLVDLGPMRGAVAESASRPMPAVLDRSRVAQIVRDAQAVAILPRASCLLSAAGQMDRETYLRIAQSSMEIELAAAYALRPINSAFTARDMLDCSKETDLLRQPLQPGIAYFYLDDFIPDIDQLRGQELRKICGLVDHVRYCLLQHAGPQ